jgi:hypothetical protein
MTRIEILDPVALRRAPRRKLAARPDGLGGRRLGLLVNGKPGSLAILEALRDRLVAERDMRPGPLLQKRFSSAAAEAAELAALARQSDVVVTALGD